MNTFNTNTESKQSNNFTIDHKLLRKGYIELLKNMNTKFHFTITFRYGLSGTLVEETLNEILKQINRAILKDQYNIHGLYISGVAVKQMTREMNNPHFHILVEGKDLYLPEFKRFDEIIQKKKEFINKSSRFKNNITSCYLQDYYDGNLEQYVTRDFEDLSLSLNEKSNRIYPINLYGVKF
jgi:hypothetical protein